MNGFDLLTSPRSADRKTRQRIHGAVIGIVTSNEDPDKLGRVKVRFPWLTDDDASHWARVSSPMAGNGRGLYLLPEIDDEVLVVFEQGIIEHPYVIGALWNGKDKPPAENSDGKNNCRVLKSRSGHIIVLDDTDGDEKIIIRDKSGETEIVMDVKGESLTITSKKDLNLNAGGNISIAADSNEVAIKCKSFLVDARDSFEIKSTKKGTIKAGTAIAIDCMPGVNINSGALEVK